MPRIPPVPRSELEGEFAEEFAIRDRVAGWTLNDNLTLAHSPELLRRTAALTRFILYEPGQVEPELKWLVGHMASTGAVCRHCQAHTALIASRNNVATEKIDRIYDFESDPLFSARERSALRVALYAGMTPNQVTNEHFDELKQHFSTKEIVELVAVISLFGFFNRWNDTIATALEDAPRTFADQHLAPQGWDIGRHG